MIGHTTAAASLLTSATDSRAATGTETTLRCAARPKYVDRRAAPRQRDHHRILAHKRLQVTSELVPGIATVDKPHECCAKVRRLTWDRSVVGRNKVAASAPLFRGPLAASSVWLSDARGDGPVFEKILVGYDGSERSEDALALARLLRGLDRGRLIATCVYWDRPLAPGIAHGGLDATPEDAELAQRTLPERFGSAIEVRSIADVSASRALFELAETEAADLIVVGSTGRGKVGQTLPGTTAERLLDDSPCPVAVAPLGYRDTAPERLERVGAAIAPIRRACLRSMPRTGSRGSRAPSWS
jgi:nucleotide-binding universal stress UspA family protein